MQHDGQLVPFRTLPGKGQATAAGLVLILDDGHRRAALGVDRVADVVACAMTIEQPADGAGLAGVALVDGRPVEVVDTGWLMGEAVAPRVRGRSEEHTSERQSLMRISYAVFCLEKKK